jgi:hypothetical protein
MSRDNTLIEFMKNWGIPFFPQEESFFNHHKSIYVGMSQVMVTLVFFFVNEDTKETLTLQRGEFKKFKSHMEAMESIDKREGYKEVETIRYKL